MTERIKYLFKHLNYEAVTDAQHDLLCSFEKQFQRRGELSERQQEILKDIFKQAEDRAASRPWWEAT